jgi:hypothetical protein
MGLATTRIAICAFIYGLCGLTFRNHIDGFRNDPGLAAGHWGKPSFSYIQNMPAFVPIMFEETVFFAAHLMVITFYMRSRLWPFKKAENPDVRTTDDHFLMEVSVGGKDNESDMVSFFQNTGAVEVKVIEKHDHE